MVKLAGPCMSLGASGKLGGSIVFSNWKGIPYARGLVTPANPKSVKQVSVRTMFAFLSQEWKGLSTATKADWIDRAKAGNYSPFNAFMGYNQNRWRAFEMPSFLDPATEDDTVGAALPHTSVGAIRQATITCQLNATNNNWGFVIARSLTTGFTPGFTNVIAVLHAIDTDAHPHIDTPLAAATYYYRTTNFSQAGKLAPGWEAETSAVVTDV